MTNREFLYEYRFVFIYGTLMLILGIVLTIMFIINPDPFSEDLF